MMSTMTPVPWIMNLITVDSSGTVAATVVDDALDTGRHSLVKSSFRNITSISNLESTFLAGSSHDLETEVHKNSMNKYISCCHLQKSQKLYQLNPTSQLIIPLIILLNTQLAGRGVILGQKILKQVVNHGFSTTLRLLAT